MSAGKRGMHTQKPIGGRSRITGLLFGAVLLLWGGSACQSGSKPADTASSAGTSGLVDTAGQPLAGEGQRSQAVDRADDEENDKVAVLRFEKDSYDFGAVKEGQKVEHEYVFKNEGEAPLIIGQVTASCGCTTPEYSRKPIAPGEKGSIKVVFDSNGQLGQQHKIITVQTNAKGGIGLLHLRGQVQSKK